MTRGVGEKRIDLAVAAQLADQQRVLAGVEARIEHLLAHRQAIELDAEVGGAEVVRMAHLVRRPDRVHIGHDAIEVGPEGVARAVDGAAEDGDVGMLGVEAEVALDEVGRRLAIAVEHQHQRHALGATPRQGGVAGGGDAAILRVAEQRHPRVGEQGADGRIRFGRRRGAVVDQQDARVGTRAGEQTGDAARHHRQAVEKRDDDRVRRRLRPTPPPAARLMNGRSDARAAAGWPD